MTKPIYKQKSSWIGLIVFALGFLADPAILPFIPLAWAPLCLKIAGAAGFINSIFFTRRAEESFPVSVP